MVELLVSLSNNIPLPFGLKARLTKWYNIKSVQKHYHFELTKQSIHPKTVNWMLLENQVCHIGENLGRLEIVFETPEVDIMRFTQHDTLIAARSCSWRELSFVYSHC